MDFYLENIISLGILEKIKPDTEIADEEIYKELEAVYNDYRKELDLIDVDEYFPSEVKKSCLDITLLGKIFIEACTRKEAEEDVHEL